MTFRTRLADWLQSPLVTNTIIGVILFNAVILGLETSKPLMDQFGDVILMLDKICLAVFVVEIVLKLIAHGFRFFKSGWNLFDFAIVGVAIIPGAQSFSVLRALRVLRVLRVISATPRLRRVVEGFISALPGMGSVFLLMGIIFYIGAVMATKLFGAGCQHLMIDACTDARHAQLLEWFGTLGKSAYSLFQIMTLESWSMGIVRPVMEVYPYAWAFFVPFIMVTTFAVVNLLVGLIVNSMQEAHSQEENERTDAYRDQVMARLESIEKRLSEK
ncbi:ion transporter [Parasulfitobacter algicola]|uniref:Ion transporter n=1 Tax=Parasulfitobacter algicola TaxID=2614809 RepID=A0ABX2ITF1_9RHOB|nr:ion transporter [Sulfitobacter algicola]NSX53556.1 ion transporter [Sulfitobacter algicola]